MPIGHLQRVGVADVDLLLPRPPFALRVLDRDAGALQALADGAHDAFLLGGLQDVIVLDVAAGGLEAVEALAGGALVALVEQIELELGGEVGAHVALLEPGDLGLQDLPRRMRHLVVVVIEHVAQHQRGALEPRRACQGREVGLHDEVAVALLPARRRVAGHRLHVDVVGEEIVAAVRLLVGPADEELGLETLADQAPLHVGEGHDDGVDLAGLDGGLQCIERQISGHDGGIPQARSSKSRMLARGREVVEGGGCRCGSGPGDGAARSTAGRQRHRWVAGGLLKANTPRTSVRRTIRRQSCGPAPSVRSSRTAASRAPRAGTASPASAAP